MVSHPFLVSVPEARYFKPDSCANCFEPLPEDVTSLWCSTWCNDVNAKVRYWRSVERDGRIEDPDIRFQIQMDMAFLLIGGYRALGRRPAAATRKEVIERDLGRCQICGKPGSEVDHVAGNLDDSSNLQLLCAKCHRAKTAESLEPANDESKALIFALHLSRVLPDDPQLLADDERSWAGLWQKLRTERKERFLKSIQASGVKIPRKHLSRRQLIALRDSRRNTN